MVAYCNVPFACKTGTAYCVEGNVLVNMCLGGYAPHISVLAVFTPYATVRQAKEVSAVGNFVTEKLKIQMLKTLNTNPSYNMQIPYQLEIRQRDEGCCCLSRLYRVVRTSRTETPRSLETPPHTAAGVSLIFGRFLDRTRPAVMETIQHTNIYMSFSTPQSYALGIILATSAH